MVARHYATRKKPPARSVLLHPWGLSHARRASFSMPGLVGKQQPSYDPEDGPRIKGTGAMTGRTRPASGANLTLGTRRSGRSDNRKRPFAALPAWLPVRNERAHERSFAPKTGNSRSPRLSASRGFALARRAMTTPPGSRNTSASSTGCARLAYRRDDGDPSARRASSLMLLGRPPAPPLSARHPVFRSLHTS